MRVPPPKPAVTAVIFSCTAPESRCRSAVTSASRVWNTNTRASAACTKARAMRRNSCACVSMERLTSTRMNSRGRSRRGVRHAGDIGTPPVCRLARSVRRTSRRLPFASSRQRRVSIRRNRRAMPSARRCSVARSCGSHCDRLRSCNASVRLAPPWARDRPVPSSSRATASTAVSARIAPSPRGGALKASSPCRVCTTWRRSRDGRVCPLTLTVPCSRSGCQ